MARAAGPLTGRGRGLGTVVAALAAHPRLWPVAARQARALVPSGWWRRRPFLPVPDAAWLRFRLTTAYGSGDAPIEPEHLLEWLSWSDTVRNPVRR